MQAIRAMIITLVTLWVAACSSADEAPKAKSTSGDALSADGGGGSSSTTTPAQAANTEQNSSSTEKAKAEEDEKESDDDEGDDGEDGEDDEESKGKGSALSFKSSHRDDNDYSIAVKVGSKDWERKEWPNEGETIQFAGLCKGSKVTIQVKVIHEDGKEVTTGSQLKVEANGKTAKVAFEQGNEESDGSAESSPDDLVGELSCSKTKLTVK